MVIVMTFGLGMVTGLVLSGALIQATKRIEPKGCLIILVLIIGLLYLIFILLTLPMFFG